MGNVTGLYGKSMAEEPFEPAPIIIPGSINHAVQISSVSQRQNVG